MIKLFRTHPRHLAGTKVSAFNSAPCSIHGLHEAPRFGSILQNALETVTHTLSSSKKATPLPQGFSRPILSLHDIHHDRKISPAPPSPATAPAGQANSVSTPSKGAKGFEPLIEEASRNFGVEKALIRAVIKAESDFNPRAKSRSGAVGLMQLLPSTARELGVRDLYDPRDNITGGTRYLAMLLDRYDGNLKSALAAYNWGPGNIEKTPDQLPGETEQYIQRVLRYLETLTA